MFVHMCLCVCVCVCECACVRDGLLRQTTRVTQVKSMSAYAVDASQEDGRKVFCGTVNPSFMTELFFGDVLLKVTTKDFIRGYKGCMMYALYIV